MTIGTARYYLMELYYKKDLHKADYSMSKTITWIATAVTFAVPMTLLICKLHAKRKENLVNRRYTTDDILFDI